MYKLNQLFVNEINGRQPIKHPTDKRLVVFTNGADQFICTAPKGANVFEHQPVIRIATEEESNHHRSQVAKVAHVTMCID